MDRARAGPSTPVSKKQCNCKNSRCLKLYCECFASGRYCDGCNCSNCFNNRENEHVRMSAVEAILERNPNAFRPKIQAQEEAVAAVPRHTAPPADAGGKHSKGCNCKKSACLKKYCECFQAGVFCSESCKCVECKNYEGSEQRAQVIACLNMQPGGWAAADPSSPSSMGSPLKRARSMTGPSSVAMPTFNPALAAAAAAMVARGGPLGGLGLAQPAAGQGGRPILHQMLSEIIKSNVVEDACKLLLLVADEEAERQEAAAAANTDGLGSNREEDNEKAQAERVARLREGQERVVLEEFLSVLKKLVNTASKKAAAHQPAPTTPLSAALQQFGQSAPVNANLLAASLARIPGLAGSLQGAAAAGASVWPAGVGGSSQLLPGAFQIRPAAMPQSTPSSGPQGGSAATQFAGDRAVGRMPSAAASSQTAAVDVTVQGLGQVWHEGSRAVHWDEKLRNGAEGSGGMRDT